MTNEDLTQLLSIIPLIITIYLMWFKPDRESLFAPKSDE